MVARNLERGGGFLHPQLDTGPFPNLFVVEPPVYAALVVGLRRITGLPLDAAGRAVSAVGTTLAAWGLHGLIAARQGLLAARLSVLALAVLPITLRYGRAFQPDALMLGALVAGLRCRDEFARSGGRGWGAAGLLLLATGLALKIVSAFIVVPWLTVIERPRRERSLVLAALVFVPALLWYAHAAEVLSAGQGSAAPADSRAIWARALVPAALLRGAYYRTVARFWLIRSFSPLGFVLAALGLLRLGRQGEAARLWAVWLGSALLTLLWLAGKSHHEYYWLALAPLAAVGVGSALAGTASGLGPGWSRAIGAGFVVLALVQGSSTWKTPPEYRGLRAARDAIDRVAPRGELIVASEALLYHAGRRGCRLEMGPAACRRAAGEWRGVLDAADPLALVEFYRGQGARYLADLAAAEVEPARRALHQAIRRRYRVVHDGGGMLVAELVPKEQPDDAERYPRRVGPRLPPLEAGAAEDRRPDGL
jgi:4-amino-4-deoxy-L-arabinose transferase-like glycosyltransferase